MNARTKAAFIRELARNVVGALIRDIPEMPECWDGHELRALLARRFSAEQMTVGSARPGYRKRTREFRAECAKRKL